MGVRATILGTKWVFETRSRRPPNARADTFRFFNVLAPSLERGAPPLPQSVKRAQSLWLGGNLPPVDAISGCEGLVCDMVLLIDKIDARERGDRS